MAKTIKFNLICDDKPVRTIEDLQNNFSIEDVLMYYNNKLLHRWLNVRGYSEELEKVNSITTENQIEIIKELIRIFAVATDDKKVAESVYMLKYTEQRHQLYANYKKESYQVKKISTNYINNYNKIIVNLIENNKNMPLIKCYIKELEDNYYNIFRISYYETIIKIFKDCPMSIYIMLTKEKLRKHMLIDEIFEDASSTDLEMVNTINKLICSNDFYSPKNVDSVLEKNVLIASGPTEDYWKDIEPSEKKILLIRAGERAKVRSAYKTGEEINNPDYMKKFLILDGLDIKAPEDSYVRYMEV